jgi:SAM-dependent methyltransferase
MRRLIKAVLKSVLPKRSRVRLRRMAYFGAFFQCPVCGSSVRKLLPGGHDFPVLRDLEIVGAGYSPQDVCPVCFSGSRTRLVHHYLAVKAGLSNRPGPIRVLHVAPEQGIAEWLMRLTSVEYVPADLAPEHYDHVSAIKMDITRIQFPDERFDMVICNHVLEHVPDDMVAMRELHRVLKPGGTAILQVPLSMKLRATLEDPRITNPRDRERVFGQSDHVRVYGTDYSDRLARAGFSVSVVNPVEQWGKEAVVRLRLNPREKLMIGRKS